MPDPKRNEAEVLSPSPKIVVLLKNEANSGEIDPVKIATEARSSVTMGFDTLPRNLPNRKFSFSSSTYSKRINRLNKEFAKRLNELKKAAINGGIGKEDLKAAKDALKNDYQEEIEKIGLECRELETIVNADVGIAEVSQEKYENISNKSKINVLKNFFSIGR